MKKQSSNQEAQKLQICLQCKDYFSQNMVTFMAQFQAHICKQCYKIQSQYIMNYKKNKPKLYPSIDQILTDIYLGNEDSATDPQTFSSFEISAVCVCGDYLLTPFEDKFDYKKYDISDSINQKILHFFDENYEWVAKMRQQKKKILFHCAAGVSRSASFVIAYIMKYQKISYQEAFNFVKSKRSIIRPNSAFIEQLKQYEKQLFLDKTCKIDQKQHVVL